MMAGPPDRSRKEKPWSLFALFLQKSPWDHFESSRLGRAFVSHAKLIILNINDSSPTIVPFWRATPRVRVSWAGPSHHSSRQRCCTVVKITCLLPSSSVPYPSFMGYFGIINLGPSCGLLELFWDHFGVTLGIISGPARLCGGSVWALK